MSTHPDVARMQHLTNPDVAFLTLRRCTSALRCCTWAHTKSLKRLKNAPAPTAYGRGRRSISEWNRDVAHIVEWAYLVADGLEEYKR